MKLFKLLLILFGIVLAAGVGAFIYSATRAQSVAPKQPAVFSPKAAPDFKLELFSGQTISLKDFAGKTPVVINIWASWCGPCREEAPVLARVSKAYEGQVKFIGIVYKDTQPNAMDFMRQFGITYDNGMDRDNIATKYGITGVPETFWIDIQGNVVYHWIGAINEANLTARTRQLLQ